MPRDDEDDRPRRKRREDDEDERPRGRREEDEEEDLREERRPKRKRPADEDEEEATPRRKRRADEDDEDRPRRKRRDEEEDEEDDDEDDDFEDYGRKRRKKKRLPSATLHSIVIYQRVLIFCILGNLCIYLGTFALPEGKRLWILVVAVPLLITAATFTYLLGAKVFNVGLGIMFTILIFVPCIGLIMLAVLNGKATSVLKKNGVPVGFFGASTADI